MSYTALYRKWRPRTFDEVIGQEAVCRTLKNQIKSGRIGHAYLFCGTRGTGKTSLAKILARAVNCEAQEEGNPCNCCETCKSVLSGSLMNIIELDAASNNGVEDIRSIREQVIYPPAQGKYKVFIIDEVHMLSPGAFNALLKTLEEPPEYVIFILATTEVHKIPVTVLSRCQRYDLRRIGVREIAKRLELLCEAEGIEIEEKALEYIAKRADGAMRDALSLLDEAAAFHEHQKIGYEEVLEILGTADIGVFADFFAALAAADTTALLELVDEIFIQGREPGQFIIDFLWYMRNILIIKSSEHAEALIDLSEENISLLKKASSAVSKESLMRYIRIFAELSNRLRYATGKRVLIELTLIRICMPQMDADGDALKERLAGLERKLDELANADIMSIQKKQKTSIEKQEEKKTEKIRLPKAEFDDLIRLRKSWKNAVESLSGAGKIVFRETYIEPLREGEVEVIFTDAGNFKLADNKSYAQELSSYVDLHFKKEMVFHYRLKEEREERQYISEEDFSEIIDMNIEYE
ncbi:MAG: DNA polymerase III subunit gamma/tau [Johnsonella sp.]|nr:DNA polymerase III subunit gamma/tau [Johnsonella sp.]